MELSKRERRRLKLEKLRQGSSEAQEEYEQRIEHQKQQHEQHNKSRKSKYYVIAAVVLAAVLSIVAFSASKSGSYDNFAKCIAEKGAVMYGAMDWCKYTQAQKGMFGKSFKYINYREHTELPGIKKTPTWVINGQWYENAQSFERLSELTGCKI